MHIQYDYKGRSYKADLSNGKDLSIPLANDSEQVNCFWAPLFEIIPVRTEQFTGSIEEGGLVNFKNVRLNPHGNGTHTECIGHISKEVFNINQVLKTFHFPAQLVTIIPQKLENGDRVIGLETLEMVLEDLDYCPALIIRTTPNTLDKKKQVYSGTNPCYFSKEAMDYIVKMNIEHLLVDIPSLDREEDGGKLEAHNTFWNYWKDITNARTHCTVTELIYVEDSIKDGQYLLNLQIASFEMDASPSKPVIYPLG
jgi:arylformamidase